MLRCRVFAAARTHTFEQLGAAIDAAFARWDLAHLSLFTLADETPVCSFETWEEPPDDAVDGDTVKLSRLAAGERFAYVFDMGDDWSHLCTVGEQRIDPVNHFGVVPADPVAYRGWGVLPDQYARLWDGDEGPSALSSVAGHTGEELDEHHNDQACRDCVRGHGRSAADRLPGRRRR